MDRIRHASRRANDVGETIEQSDFNLATTSGMDFETVIRLAPATWLCIVNSDAAPATQPYSDSAGQVIALAPHLEERLREVLDEIVQAQAMSGADNAIPLAGLTCRQREIVDMVRRGASNKLIARQLGLSVGTVKVHMHRIFRALHISNRVQLATLPNPSV
jgi:DNA-binding NarL/FixJ family response regulator